jgi:hypothetical protein
VALGPGIEIHDSTLRVENIVDGGIYAVVARALHLESVEALLEYVAVEHDMVFLLASRSSVVSRYPQKVLGLTW